MTLCLSSTPTPTPTATSLVTKNNYMLGSYGPKAESQTAMTPWDEMPSGMLARGHYTVKSKFTDDDKETHLAWEWSFDLKKEW